MRVSEENSQVLMALLEGVGAGVWVALLEDEAACSLESTGFT